MIERDPEKHFASTTLQPADDHVQILFVARVKELLPSVSGLPRVLVSASASGAQLGHAGRDKELFQGVMMAMDTPSRLHVNTKGSTSELGLGLQFC